ncbi:MAG TPA: head GIN domain-containing protein [Caldimonas sp.]|nr:head GIN domain-containing protein [Caldimonas sp.]
MKFSRRQGLVIVGALASLMACSSLLAADGIVEGSGRMTSVTRPAAGVARLAVAGPFSVEVRQGSHPGVTLEGDDNLLALVETRIDGPTDRATLHIAPIPGVTLEPTQPIRVRIEVAALAAIDLAGDGRVFAFDARSDRLDVAIGGGGRVELPRLEAKVVAVRIGGSGAIRADGRAGNLSVRIGGSGRCDADRLIVDDATVSIGGSGRADVDATERLVVSIAGSGRVRQHGAAVPQVSVVGSGRVDRL